MTEPAPAKELVLFAQSRRVIDQVYHGLDPRLLTDVERTGYLPTYAAAPLASAVMNPEAVEYTSHPEMSAEEYACILRAWRIGEENGFRIRLIDVTQESDLRSWIHRHLHDLHEFPVLLLPDGSRLSGPAEFTEQRLRSALAREP